MKNRRPWVRELFDEQIIRRMICEEFSSKPVFDYQMHQVGDAAEEARGKR